MDLQPAPELGARLAQLTETERSRMAALTVWWNQAPRELAVVELDDDYLLKVLRVNDFDMEQTKVAVRTFVAWSVSLGGGLGAAQRLDDATAACLEACLVHVVRTPTEVALAVNAQRCVDAFAAGPLTAAVCARCVAYLLNLCTDDPLGFADGVTLVFDARVSPTTLVASLVDIRTVLSYMGRFPVRCRTTRVLLSSSRTASLLSTTIGALLSSFDFVDAERVAASWGPEPPLKRLPVWLGGEMGELEEKVEASGLVARLRVREAGGSRPPSPGLAAQS